MDSQVMARNREFDYGRFRVDEAEILGRQLLCEELVGFYVVDIMSGDRSTDAWG